MTEIIYKYFIPIALLSTFLCSSCNTNGEVFNQLNQKQIDLTVLLENSHLTTQEFQEINAVVEPISTEVKNKFSQLFYEWKEDWKTNPKTLISSNIQDAKRLERYQLLLNMGPQILPLIIKELTIKNNFIGLVLYDDLQEDPSQKIDYTAPEYQKYLLEGEQGRAVRTIRLWLNSNS